MKAQLLITIITLFSFTLLAQDGNVDTSFGNNGSVRIPYYEKDAQVLTILRIDDDLFAAGYTKETKEDFTIVKMDLDGNLDSNFGEDGTMRFVIGQGFGRCSKLIQHPDGDILAIGWDRNVNKDEYILIKMDVTGNLDNSFGDAGIASGNWDNSTYAESEIADAAFLSDGRLIAAGRSYNGSNTDFVVACYDSNGNPCSDFGDDGIIIQLFNDIDHWEIAQEVLVDADDNIYVAGENRDDENFVVKYNSMGNLDTSFGNQGILIFTHPAGVTGSIGELSIDYNNRLLICGTVFSDASISLVSRYDSNGNLDTNFGDQGSVLLSSVNRLSINDAKIIDDNSLLIAGNTSGFGTKQILVKIDNSGSIVPTFGTNGVVTLQLATTFTGASEIAIDSESIYVGGYAFESDFFEFAITKFSNQIVRSKDVFDENMIINLYPNPVDHQLYIEAEDGINAIEVYDISGKVIYREAWIQAEYQGTINTSRWQSGIYNIIVKNKNRVSSSRFIKK